MGDQRSELLRAREAFAGGDLKRTIRHAWRAGTSAARDADPDVLEAVIELADAVGDRADGREKAHAEELSAFCRASLLNVRTGILPSSSLLGTLLQRRPERATKACPACAETVKPAAAVCRFCGHRFDSA